MKVTRTALVFLLAVFVCGTMALQDNDAFRVVWEAPVDQAFFLDSNNTVDITVSVYGQDDSLMDGLVPQLTVAIVGGNTLVNRLNMTDNGDGTYTRSNVNLATAVDEYLQLTVRVPLASGSFRMFQSIITVYYGADYGPDGDVWKIDFVEPAAAEQTTTDSIDVTVQLYNDSGQLWAGEAPTITVNSAQGFGTVVNNQAMTDNNDGTYSYTIAAGALTENTDYEVRVVSNTTNTAREFRIIEATPGPSVQLIPVASPTYDVRPTFNWYDFPGASSYTIVIDDNANFLSPIINTPTSDTFYTPTVDLPAGTVYWRVTADNNPAGPGVDTFEILDPDIPLIIEYTPDPTREKRPTLTWHPVSGASTYEIQIDDSQFFGTPTITETVSDTFYTPLIDLAVGTMYWRVRSDLSTTWSSVDNFTILNDSIPILYTFDGDTQSVARPAFEWQPVTGASYYQIQISTSRFFNTTVINTPTSDTTYTPLIDLADDVYYWRVATDLRLNLYSQVDSFVVETAGPGVEAGAGLKGVTALTVSPNPFNLVTSILVHNPGGNVSLRILDVRGRMVAEFKNVRDGRVVWNTAGLSKGVYIVKAETAGKTLTRKISLIK